MTTTSTSTGVTVVTGLTRGDGTEGGEEGKGEGGEDIPAQAHGRTGQSDQSKVVQEVLADLKKTGT